MICGASIARRDGRHLRCRLDDNHEGACDPWEQLELLPLDRSRGLPFRLVFVGHFALAVVIILICCLGGGR